MNWGGEDFLAAAILLASAVIGVWAVRRFAANGVLRLIGYAFVLAALLLIWAALAVGIFH
jgi:hypothetical protein